MKYNEETFNQEINKIYNGEIKIVGRFKNLVSPIMVQDKYGVLKINSARQLLKYKPNIKAALNKETYFMAMLKEKYPKIATNIKPASKYEGMRKKMLFETKYGLVAINPDALLHGHTPNIRSAVNRKDYMQQQLTFLYDGKYQFRIDSTNRKLGRIILICPKHGEQSIDSDTIFTGCGCPKCNNHLNKSYVFYLVKLYNEHEQFYKLGISHFTTNNQVRRFKDYKNLGYKITPIKIIQLNSWLEAKEFEAKLKHLICNNLYKPKYWNYNTSTECFTDSLLPLILNTINEDIVSTSNKNQSSESEQNLTTSTEDI